MYTLPSASDYHNSNSMSYDDVLPSPDVVPLFPPPPPTHLLPPSDHHQRQLTELESLVNMAHSSSSTTNSGYSSYDSPSYSTSQGPSFMQRSISSHTLQNNNYNNGVHRFMSANDFLDMDTCPVRKVFSTGDLHRINNVGQRSGSPLASESSLIIEAMNRACPYSPEEKKERIERYRSKKTQRNFNKRIKYECRKTLADSRPRIRGRFARNEEIEKSHDEVQWNHLPHEEYYEDDDNWINYIDSVSSSNIF